MTTTTMIFVIAAGFAVIVTSDGRASRRGIERRYSIRTTKWLEILATQFTTQVRLKESCGVTRAAFNG